MNIDELKEKLKYSVSYKIYNHSLKTMEEAEKLAVTHDVNVEKAKIAALLHDCGKSKNKEGDNLLHAKLGAKLAKDIYNVSDIEIRNAIMYHTTGREAMSKLEKIVFIADKIEPGRFYDAVDEIRILAFDNIDKALIKSLESTIDYVKKRNLELDIESEKTLNYLKGGTS